MMDSTSISRIIDLLENCGVDFKAGLDDDQIHSIEYHLGAKIPQDYKQLLEKVVPFGNFNGESFPDWHNNPKGIIEKYRTTIYDAFEFDIKNNSFWISSLGAKSNDQKQAVHDALIVVKQSPALMPVFGHRFIPAVPNEVGNPIFSFLQPTDVVVYGTNLIDYFENEFGEMRSEINLNSIKRIAFWSDLLEY